MHFVPAGHHGRAHRLLPSTGAALGQLVWQLDVDWGPMHMQDSAQQDATVRAVVEVLSHQEQLLGKTTLQVPSSAVCV